MKDHHRRRMIAGAAIGAAVVTTLSAGAARVLPQPAPSVQTVARAPEVAIPPGQKGATYFWLEGQTKKLTMRFAGATATAERDPFGKLNTTLTDPAGNELGRFQVNRADGVRDTLRYIDASGTVLQAVGDPNLHPTLDWSNRQIYQLWQDKIDSTSALEWRDGVMRRKGAAARDAERDILELEAEWSNGLTARTTRKVAAHHEAVKGRFVDGETLATVLTDSNGTDIGVSYWYAGAQLYVWSIPVLQTGGFIGPEHLQRDFGGWPFTPDMAWMNLQTLAFHHFKTLINQKRFVARADAPRAGLLQFFAPTVSANEDGCDDLHWLDNSVFRFCCDEHDRCYEKVGCSSSSWWQVWSSWLCDFCNMTAVHCFLTGGLGSGGPGKLA
jgi:hypothetical protein